MTGMEAHRVGRVALAAVVALAAATGTACATASASPSPDPAPAPATTVGPDPVPGVKAPAAPAPSPRRRVAAPRSAPTAVPPKPVSTATGTERAANRGRPASSPSRHRTPRSTVHKPRLRGTPRLDLPVGSLWPAAKQAAVPRDRPARLLLLAACSLLLLVLTSASLLRLTARMSRSPRSP